MIKPRPYFFSYGYVIFIKKHAATFSTWLLLLCIVYSKVIRNVSACKLRLAACPFLINNLYV